VPLNFYQRLHHKNSLKPCAQLTGTYNTHPIIDLTYLLRLYAYIHHWVIDPPVREQQLKQVEQIPYNVPWVIYRAYYISNINANRRNRQMLSKCGDFLIKTSQIQPQPTRIYYSGILYKYNITI
jgi:hypothetical protein